MLVAALRRVQPGVTAGVTPTRPCADVAPEAPVKATLLELDGTMRDAAAGRHGPSAVVCRPMSPRSLANG
jgi:hypothetical protein